ncbi:uncharacterized protein LOC124420391 isoform X1 [Lucilia cuprina]|uniref:uncharacterized protein LOC124420391 isoform X1 n=2 Tax=Lucilia cuprina TaxID=7375 RepID=UPI001F05ECF0|nr:uncharacterized protein LOC124420391 isoform X1 [Lucilia cuprina]
MVQYKLNGSELKKRMSNRHRRTRIYGANYDIGESYYKKQLNDLDNKSISNRNINTAVGIDTLNDSKTSPKVSFLCSDLEYNDKALRLPRVNTKFSEDEDEDYKTFPKLLSEHKHFSDYDFNCFENNLCLIYAINVYEM